MPIPTKALGGDGGGGRWEGQELGKEKGRI